MPELIHFQGQVITIWQPWAEAIRIFGKDIENRSWLTRYRGPLAIHAGQFNPDSKLALEMVRRAAGPERYYESAGFYLIGHLIAVCTLADCLPYGQVSSRWASGPYCWRLTDVVAIEPIAWRGAQGLRPAEFDYRPLVRP